MSMPVSPDGMFPHIVVKIADMILLSFVWIFLCFTVIGIGPATTALYYAMVKSVRRDRGFTFTEFTHSLKESWKVSLIVGLIFVACGALVWFYDLPNMLHFFTGKSENSIVWDVFSSIRVFLFSCLSAYVFPIISRFKLSPFQVIMTALVVSVRHFLSTLAILVIMAAALFLSIQSPFLLCIMPSLVALLLSYNIEPIFKKLILKSQNVDGSTTKSETAAGGETPWYLQ